MALDPDPARTRGVLGVSDKPVKVSHPRRVAVVTGASDDSGAEMCRQLAKSGFTVVLTCRDSAEGKALAQQLRKDGGDVVFQRLDVDNPRSVRSLAGYIEQTYGRVDVLVNNAAVLNEPLASIGDRAAGGLLATSNETVRRTLETNMLGTLSVIQALGPSMKKAKAGHILNISSELSRMHAIDTGVPAYRMSKAALNTMTSILADELAASGVRVNTVQSGRADSTVWLASLEPADAPTGAYIADRTVEPARDPDPLPQVSRTKPQPDEPVALVTGGTAGMGLETCRQLAQRGYKVVMTGRSEDKGQACAEALRAEGLDVVFKKLDVTQQADADRVASELKEAFGGVDVVINNAGVLHEPLATMGDRDAGGLLAASHDTVRRSMETNTLGPINLARSMAPLMKERGGGRIINISSLLAREETLGVGIPGYRISKAALNVATIMLAKELAADGITVNAVDPGWVKTALGGDAAPKSVEEGTKTAVWLATSEAGGVETGGFFEDEKRSKW